VTAQLACGFNVFVNAGGLRVYGAELETAVRPVDGLTLTAGSAYTDSELTSALAFVNGRKGDHAPYTPRWTFNASADFRWDLASAVEAFAFVNYQHTGRRNQSFNADSAANIVLPAYDSLNARIGIKTGHWSAELFGQNLTNSLGQVNRRFTPFPYIPATLVTVVKPRTIGIKLGYKL
jgi:iron complex outermembrane receptor protein